MLPATIKSYEPELMKFRTFLTANGIPLSTGYQMAARGELRVLRIGGRGYVDLEHWRAKVKTLPAAPIRPAA